MASKAGRAVAGTAGWISVVPLVLLGVAIPAAALDGPAAGRSATPHASSATSAPPSAKRAAVQEAAAALAAADLAVTISGPDLLPYGDSAHITYTVTNVGDSPSAPADLHVTRFPQESGTNASGCTSAGPSDPADCPVATLAAGQSVSFAFIARPQESAWGGSGTVSAALAPGDANPANDSASLVIQFAGPTTFEVTLDGPGPTVIAGSTIKLRVTITNTGQNPGVTAFEFSFDETMEPLSPVGPSTVDCGADPFSWQCVTDGIDSGAVTTVEFPFRIPVADVGRRLTATLNSDDEARWTALVVGPSADPTTSSPAPQQTTPASGPAAGQAGTAPTLAATGASPVPGALLGGLLFMVGLCLVVASRRRSTQPR
jgi:hypothetical protein